MPTLTTGVIKSMRLPDLLAEHSEQIGGRGADNWTHSYRIPDSKYPEITLRYSGFPLQENAKETYRDLLAKGSQIIFWNNNPQFSSDPSKQLLKELSAVLGNSGDNQISNTNNGYDGPMFRLEKLEVCQLSGRSVIRINGWFHNPALEPKVFLDCIFIDAQPDSKTCQVEQLYLQAFPVEQFQEFLPEFDKVLASISWSN